MPKPSPISQSGGGFVFAGCRDETAKASVARMSKGTSGIFILSLNPAYRCADAGSLLNSKKG
jgi:hypothetical protein